MNILEIKHLMLDRGLNNELIARTLKEQYGSKISSEYICMILSGQRTGYKYRGQIARVMGVPVGKLFPPKKKARLVGSKKVATA